MVMATFLKALSKERPRNARGRRGCSSLGTSQIEKPVGTWGRGKFAIRGGAEMAELMMVGNQGNTKGQGELAQNSMKEASRKAYGDH
jgi:hypothetical protein